MGEAHASAFCAGKGYGINGALNALEYHTSSVVHDSVGHYSINPDMREALSAAMDERES